MTRSIYSQSLPFTLKLCLQESFWEASGSFRGSRSNENGTKAEKGNWRYEKTRPGKSGNSNWQNWKTSTPKTVISIRAEPKSMVFVSMFAKGVVKCCTKSNQMSASNNARFSRSCQEYVVQACWRPVNSQTPRRCVGQGPSGTVLLPESFWEASGKFPGRFLEIFPEIPEAFRKLPGSFPEATPYQRAAGPRGPLAHAALWRLWVDRSSTRLNLVLVARAAEPRIVRGAHLVRLRAKFNHALGEHRNKHHALWFRPDGDDSFRGARLSVSPVCISRFARLRFFGLPVCFFCFCSVLIIAAAPEVFLETFHQIALGERQAPGINWTLIDTFIQFYQKMSCLKKSIYLLRSRILAFKNIYCLRELIFCLDDMIWLTELFLTQSLAPFNNTHMLFPTPPKQKKA